MIALARPPLTAVLFALALGCGSNGGGSGSDGGSGGGTFADQICAKLTQCGQSVSNCQGEFAAIVLSSQCQSTVLNAPCSDFSSATLPPDLVGCFPACTGTQDVCNGDDVVTCSNGNQYTLACSGVCAAQSKTYTGTCAASYMGQPATNGQGCFCQ